MVGYERVELSFVFHQLIDELFVYFIIVEFTDYFITSIKLSLPFLFTNEEWKRELDRSNKIIGELYNNKVDKEFVNQLMKAK